MEPVTINPLYIEIGVPALLAGVVLGALIAWILARRKQQRLELQIKSQEALQNERDSAFDAANARLMQAFSEISEKSLKSNNESFLQLAEQKLNLHNEKAKRPGSTGV